MSNSQSYIVTASCLFLLLLLSACEPERTSGKGLVLPVGNIESGKASFVDLGCVQCHSVAGVDIPEYEGESTVMLLLGGKVRRVKTYGELVTSIINPNHILSQNYLDSINSSESEGEITTPMPSFNDEMTVAQLIDLVTFLDSHYEKMMPDYVSQHHNYGAY
jgi:L-cysteine S-thiosulfotransferase